jgi:phage shock protein C
MSANIGGERRLHKSARDKVVAGVCGGLAEYFGIDPAIVRLAFVIAALAGGASVAVYIVLAIVLTDGSPDDAAAPRTANGATVVGALMAGIGVLLLAANLGWLGWMGWVDRALFWPVVLILLGAALILRRPSEPST